MFWAFPGPAITKFISFFTFNDIHFLFLFKIHGAYKCYVRVKYHHYKLLLIFKRLVHFQILFIISIIVIVKTLLNRGQTAYMKLNKILKVNLTHIFVFACIILVLTHRHSKYVLYSLH